MVTLTDFKHCSGIFIVDFEQVNAGWGDGFFSKRHENLINVMLVQTWWLATLHLVIRRFNIPYDVLITLIVTTLLKYNIVFSSMMENDLISVCWDIFLKLNESTVYRTSNFLSLCKNHMSRLWCEILHRGVTGFLHQFFTFCLMKGALSDLKVMPTHLAPVPLSFFLAIRITVLYCYKNYEN